MKQRVFKLLLNTLLCVNVMSVCAEEYVFHSYHIYTNDEDMYTKEGEQDDKCKVVFDETGQNIQLNIYNKNNNQWISYSLSVDYKIDLGLNKKIGTLFMCKNNSNETCGVCICNMEDGTFVNFQNFVSIPQSLNCWMKMGK